MTVCNCLVSVAVISSFSLDWGCETTCDSKWWLDIVSWRKSVTPLKWKLMRKTKVWFFTTGRTLLYQDADCVSSEQMNRITFQSKAQVFNCCRKLSFCLHNTLTCVCFILAPRQDVISTPTSPHWIADEIKLLTKEMCFALSSSLSHFFPPCLWTAWWIFYIQA